MKQLIYIIIFFCMSLSLTACDQPSKKKNANETITTQTTEVNNTKEEQKKDLNLLYIQTAKSAVLKKLGTRGYYTLTLYDTNPYLTYYSERPKRESGIASVDNFIKAWNVGENNFQKNNPNVLLTAAYIDGVTNKDSRFYLLTCSTPEYTIKEGITSYIVKPLPKQKLMFDHIKLDYVTLLIDSTQKKIIR